MTAFAQHGQQVRWGPGEHILASVYDVVAWANYQRAGGKGKRPSRYPRPGESESVTYGKPIPIERAREILARRSGITKAG